MAKKKTVRKAPRAKARQIKAARQERTNALAKQAQQNHPHTRGQENQHEDYRPEKEFGDEDYDYESSYRHFGRRRLPPPPFNPNIRN